MSDWTIVRERYMRDSFPLRMGGLAANLHRIKSFTAYEANREAVVSVIIESKFFIEWAAPEAEADTAAELVVLQVQLARWQSAWGSIWLDSAQRGQVAEQAHHWSERILSLSGLLKA